MLLYSNQLEELLICHVFTYRKNLSHNILSISLSESQLGYSTIDFSSSPPAKIAYFKASIVYLHT